MQYPKVLFLIILIGCMACQNAEHSNLTLLSNKIPTDSALVFGEGIVSTDNFEFAITFNPEMDELYFTRRRPSEDNAIYTMKLTRGKWSEPALAFFSTDSGWDFEPHINPKGDLLYFGSTRPLTDSLKATGMHQWYSKKSESGGWTAPVPLERPFVDKFVMYITSSEQGNLFFTSKDEGADPEDGGIYFSSQAAGYTGTNRLGREINFEDGQWIAHPFIAPDESYIIYDGERPSGYGDCDLYISFNENGTWMEGYNLGPKVNTDQCEMCASVSPDGKYLFFHRGLYHGGEGDIGNIYWIDFMRIKDRIYQTVN